MFEMPKSCKDCHMSNHYHEGHFGENSHYCCELIWSLFEEDYEVDPDTRDENCPLNNQKFFEAVKEVEKTIF